MPTVLGIGGHRSALLDLDGRSLGVKDFPVLISKSRQFIRLSKVRVLPQINNTVPRSLYSSLYSRYRKPGYPAYLTFITLVKHGWASPETSFLLHHACTRTPYSSLKLS